MSSEHKQSSIWAHGIKIPKKKQQTEQMLTDGCLVLSILIIQAIYGIWKFLLKKMRRKLRKREKIEKTEPIQAKMVVFARRFVGEMEKVTFFNLQLKYFIHII